jgi:hypothetical protein
VSQEEFATDRGALARMLAEFARDRPRFVPAAAASSGPGGSGGGSGGSGGGTGTSTSTSSTVDGTSTNISTSSNSSTTSTSSTTTGGADAALEEGMAAVMACYEAELRQPIRNLVAGDLARTLLIQVQRLKVDTEAAMLELDQAR